MKIAFVAPWVPVTLPDGEGCPSCSCINASCQTSTHLRDLLIPEQRMMEKFLQRGVECAKYLTAVAGPRAGLVVCGEGSLKWTLFPVDADSPLWGSSVRSAALAAGLRQFDPDIIIWKGWPLALADDVRDLPAIWVIKQGGASRPRLLEADAVLTESLLQSRWLRRRHGPPSVVLPKSLNSEFQKGPDSGVVKEYQIAAVGRFAQMKNYTALQPLVEAGCQIVVVGDGELKSEFELRWSSFPNVSLPGHLKAEEVREVLVRSRVLFHPSVSEGVPRVAVEAMALGLPVIGLRGVMDDVIQHGHTGLLVDSGDLVEQTLSLLADDDRLGKFGRNAMKEYEERFSAAAFEGAVDSAFELMAGLLGRSRPARFRKFTVLWMRLFSVLVAVGSRLRIAGKGLVSSASEGPSPAKA